VVGECDKLANVVVFGDASGGVGENDGADASAPRTRMGKVTCCGE
jgi:hypothetical protein